MGLEEKATMRIQAVFDGDVLRPQGKLELAPDTLVELELVIPSSAHPEGSSFLDAAEKACLDGPADWSENVDEYLYDGKSPKDG